MRQVAVSIQSPTIRRFQDLASEILANLEAETYHPEVIRLRRQIDQTARERTIGRQPSHRVVSEDQHRWRVEVRRWYDLGPGN